ncbi:MAG: DPP IV N-terminal domain-containing protein [Anaerolineae bacterium]|nr:DPP IV N-terminal domain-containing protein [Anaerolineae bacterium]
MKADFSISFFNATTGEKFELPLIFPVGAFFWMPEGTSIGLLSKDKKTIAIIDSLSGQVIFYSPSASATQFISITKNNPPFPISAHGTSPSDANFTLGGSLSVDGRYRARMHFGTHPSLDIQEIGKNNKMVFPDPDSNQVIIAHEWSPISSELAILVRQDSMDDPVGESQKYTLKIYDPSTAKVISSYPNVPGTQWSPDGTQILFDTQNWFDPYSEYDYGSTPCIFSLATGETSCINFIRVRHGPIKLFRYTWSPDGSMISYIFGSSQEDENLQTINHAGVCLAAITETSISCPTDAIAFLHKNGGWIITNNKWSPDGKHMLLTIDSSCVGCSYSTDPHLAIISTQGGQHYLLDSIPALLTPGLWRPPISP